MAKNKGIVPIKNKNVLHEVTVVHSKGRATTVLKGTSAMAVWSNKRQNGPTVRVDHSETFRFFDGAVTKSSITF